MDIQLKCTVDRQYFHVVNFRGSFGREICLTVDGYNMGKHLECS